MCWFDARFSEKNMSYGLLLLVLNRNPGVECDCLL